jgi:hypothetical protein
VVGSVRSGHGWVRSSFDPFGMDGRCLVALSRYIVLCPLSSGEPSARDPRRRVPARCTSRGRSARPGPGCGGRHARDLSSGGAGLCQMKQISSIWRRSSAVCPGGVHLSKTRLMGQPRRHPTAHGRALDAPRYTRRVVEPQEAAPWRSLT